MMQRFLISYIFAGACLSLLFGCGDTDGSTNPDAGHDAGVDTSTDTAEVPQDSAQPEPVDPCRNETLCAAVGSRCDGNVLVVCAVDRLGCMVETTSTCTAVPGGHCVEDGDEARCEFEEDPCRGARGLCDEPGRTCEGATLVVCAANANGCFVTTRTPCGASVGGFCDDDGVPARCDTDTCPERGACDCDSQDYCHPDALCTPGEDPDDLVMCACDEGFEGDGFTCADIDECADANGGCEHLCVNEPGTYTCACDEGYTLGDDGFNCEDIDECADANGGCDQLCVNEPGTFTCACNAGYTLDGDGSTCVDIDECVDANGGCDQLCVNEPGTYSCGCTEGFSLDDDGFTCVPDPTCEDGELNGNETDVDCGGDECDPCVLGQACIEGEDCDSGICEGLVCAALPCVHNPDCEVTEMPRLTLLIDASSAMLNVDGMAGAEGETTWDIVREAVNRALDALVGDGPITSRVYVSLAVFGAQVPAPGEQRTLVQFDTCARERISWALDPNTSCTAPGCTDPWGGPPLTWTPVDNTEGEPIFDGPAQSWMPRCEGSADGPCEGSGRFVHLGLNHVRNAQEVYRMSELEPPATVTPGTLFRNVLIVGDSYDGFSTSPQVQSELVQSYNLGTGTVVVGVGTSFSAAFVEELDNMASWGSGGVASARTAGTVAELTDVLRDVLLDLPVPTCVDE